MPALLIALNACDETLTSVRKLPEVDGLRQLVMRLGGVLEQPRHLPELLPEGAVHLLPCFW